MDLTAVKTFFTGGSFLKIVVAVAVILLIWIIIDRVLSGTVKRLESDESGRTRLTTYLRSIRTLIKYVLLVILVVLVLQICGVNVTSLVAGIGIASIVVGFAIQDALKDIIMGLNIVVDHYYRVGDHLIYNGHLCRVTELSLKTTRMYDLVTHHELVVRNSLINEVELNDGFFLIDIPLPYEESFEDMRRVIEVILERMREGCGVSDAQFLDISEFGASAITYKICGTAENASETPGVRRRCMSVIKQTLDEYGIRIPYTQLVLHGPDAQPEDRAGGAS